MPDLPPLPARVRCRSVAAWRHCGVVVLWPVLAVLSFPVWVQSATTPVPVKHSASGDAARWLATADTQWQTDYQRDVIGPYTKAVAEARKQYLTTIAGALAAATKAGRGEAAAWQAEQERISAATDDTPAAPPPAADAKEPASLKALRTSYLAQLARLDRERFERARGLFARADALLAKNMAALQQRQQTEDAAKLQKERDGLKTLWLQPPAVVETAPPKPPPGGVAGPPKLTSQQILEKLQTMGAGVAVKQGTNPVQEVKSDDPMLQGKLTFVRVSLPEKRPDETPLAAADYDILDGLSEVEELELRGPMVKDPVVEKLRAFKALQSLALERVTLSPAGYAVLAELPALRSLQLQETNMTDEGMAWVTKCHKLRTLSLGALPISNEGLENLGDLKELEQLNLNQLDKLDSKGFVYLADCHALKYVAASGFVILSGMVENLSHCKSLESISLPDTLLKDAEIAPLGALEKLRALDLRNASITGAVFAKWPIRREFTSLNLEGAPGVDDAVCKSLERSFPKMEDLHVQLAVSGFTAAGATELGRMHSLRSLGLAGPGITNDMVNEIAHAKTLTALSIPDAVLTDPGAAALGRLTLLTDLNLKIPPITEAALKSYSHCKALKNVNIGKDAAPETEYKLESVLPGATVHRAEE